MKFFAKLIGVAIAPLAALAIAHPATAQYAFEGFCEEQQEYFESDLVEGWCWDTKRPQVSTLAAANLAISGVQMTNGEAVLWAWVWRQHPGAESMLVAVHVTPDGRILQYLFGGPRELRGFQGHFGRALEQLSYWHP